MSSRDQSGSDASGRWQSADDDRDYDQDEVISTRWVEETRRYREPIGGWWWLALFLVPAILALLGLAVGGDKDTSAGKSPTSSSSSASGSGSASGSATSGNGTTGGTSSVKLASAPFAVSRTGKDVTVTAEAPDQASADALVAAVEGALPDANVISKVTTVAGSTAPDAAALGASVKALAGLGDFGLGYDLKSLTAVGKAADDAAKKSAADALPAAWPKGANPAINISVGDDAGASCGTLGDAIKVAMASTKVTFGTGSAALAGDSHAVLDKVAALVKGCAGVKLAVTGYTDKSGNAADNLKLSEARAQSVADYLAKAGIDKASMTVSGKGDADPIADNTWPAAAANRRVKITVVK